MWWAERKLDRERRMNTFWLLELDIYKCLLMFTSRQSNVSSYLLIYCFIGECVYYLIIDEILVTSGCYTITKQQTNVFLLHKWRSSNFILKVLKLKNRSRVSEWVKDMSRNLCSYVKRVDLDRCSEPVFRQIRIRGSVPRTTGDCKIKI